MKVSSNQPDIATKTQQSSIKLNYTQKISQDEVYELREEMDKKAKDIILDSVSLQVFAINENDDIEKNYQEFKKFLEDIGYEGKSISKLSKDEAAELISEDGIFGIDQTSKRVSDFVINGANGNEDLMRAGRKGVLDGFKEAEAIWGGELPEISQKTMQKTLEIIDKAMHDLGFSILDEEV